MDKDKFHNIIQNTCTGISMVLAVASIGLLLHITNTAETLKEYKATIESELGSNYKIAETVSEINRLYEKHGIKNNGDFDTATNIALNYYILGLNDKYGGYKDKEQHEESKAEDNEESVGLGIYVSNAKERGLLVQRVYEGSSAYINGLKAGDYIVSVDNNHINDVGYDEFIKLMHKEVGETIDLTIIRGDAEIEISLSITEFSNKSVQSRMIGDVCYINIDAFTLKTDEEFNEVVKAKSKEGCEKFVVDLRNNLGGYVDTVVDMLDFILGKGLIVEIKDCNGETIVKEYSDSNEIPGKFMVLTNNRSASASELFAQSIKDFDRGLVIGERTFGKGTAVTQFELSNGDSITLSTGLYYTNSGAQLENLGVEPDITVEMSAEDKSIIYLLDETNDVQLIEALKQLEG